MTGKPLSRGASNDAPTTYHLQQGDPLCGESELHPSWKSLFGFTTRQHTSPLCLALISSVVSGMIAPVQALLFGKIFNAYTSYGNGDINSKLTDSVSKYCLYLITLGGVSWLTHSAYFLFWLVFGELQAKSARDRLFQGMLRKEIAWYDRQSHGIGALTPRLRSHIRELQLAVSQPLGSAIQGLSTVVTSLAVALYMSWNLTLVIVGAIPVFFVVLGLISRRMQPSIQRHGQHLSKAMKYATSAFSAIDTVKCYNGQQLELEKYMSVIKSAAVSFLCHSNLNAFQIGFGQFAMLAMFVQGFWYGSSLVESRSLDSGQVLATFWAVLMASQTISLFLPQLAFLEKGKTSSSVLRAVVAEVYSEQTTSVAQQKRPGHCSGGVRLHHVSFAYPTQLNRQVLRNLSMALPPGETTFIIGKSGSGKSTIGQLILRFYEPQYGRISLDGNPLQSLDVHWLRNNITLVDQQCTLFNGTILQNIALGKPGCATAEAVKAAAQFALLQQTVHDFPSGFDTMVGAKGASLSGGQKQRLALARARIRDSPILILDESTSALDHIARSLIMDAIRVWRRGKTTIVITHDISQILDQDYVYVLDGGYVIQEGYRESLEKSEGSFFQLFLPRKPGRESKEGEPRESGEVGIASPASKYASPGTLEMVKSSSETRSAMSDSTRICFEDDILPLNASSLSVVRNQPSVAARKDHQRISGIGLSLRPINPVPILANRELFLSNPTASSIDDDSSPIFTSNPSSDSPTPRIQTGEDHIPMEILDRRGNIAQDSRRNAISKRERPLTIALCSQRLQLSHETGKTNPLRFRTCKTTRRVVSPYSIPHILRTVWPSLGFRSRLVLIAGFASAVLYGVAFPAFSFVFSRLLTTFYVPEARRRNALIYSMAILGISALGGIFLYLMHSLLECAAQQWVDQTRSEAMQRILDQPKEFYDKLQNGVSILAESLDRHAEDMKNLLGRFIGYIIVAIVILTVAIIWSLATSWKLTLVGVGTALIIYIVSSTFSTISGKWEGRCNDADERVGAIFSETFTNIRAVRSFTLEPYFLEKYSAAATFSLEIGLTRAIHCGFYFGMARSVGLFIASLLFYYGAVLVCSTQFSVTQVLQVFVMLLMSISTANSCIEQIPHISSSKVTATSLLRLATLPKTSHEHLGRVPLQSIGEIRFRNLSFTYPTRSEQTILQGVNLTIHEGSCTAIVGSSGSGKSTIASLLVKLYPTPCGSPDSGPAITVLARDIRCIYTPCLRNLISIVSQTPMLLPASVAENIMYGIPELSPLRYNENIRSAALAAGVDDFVMSLPQGYNTVIGEGGLSLSGGQAQRIAIARAIARNPHVLILDEATSALDAENAGLIKAAILRLIKERRNAQQRLTVIVITHSKDMMVIADQIFMLDQGVVVEKGTFEELKRRKGMFAKLLRAGEWSSDKGGGSDITDLDGLREVNGKGKGRAL